jgi:hypothetical protein
MGEVSTSRIRELPETRTPITNPDPPGMEPTVRPLLVTVPVAVRMV